MSSGVVASAAMAAALDELDTALDHVLKLAGEPMRARERLSALDRLERHVRRIPATRHPLLNELVAESAPVVVGAKSWKDALALRLRTTRAEAGRRLKEAKLLGPRRAITGEPLKPLLASIADAQARGTIGPEHLKIIRRTLKKLPGWVDPLTREQAEADLVRHAEEFCPEELEVLAKHLLVVFDPDGPEPNDDERMRKREFYFGQQGSDAMTAVRGNLSPEAMTYWEAIAAKFAAPGMCNPADENPCVSGTPTAEQIKNDTRDLAQRQHDALVFVFRQALASGQLGQHNGLPVTVIASTSLQALEAAAAGFPGVAAALAAAGRAAVEREDEPAPEPETQPEPEPEPTANPPMPPPAFWQEARDSDLGGMAVTGGRTLLPISDLIRMAGHAVHYLRIYDKHTKEELYLGRTKRIASPGQRIVLHARDRGCTAPGCTVPGYGCQVHHTDGWARANGQTNIDVEVLACGGDNRMAEHGWSVRVRRGIAEWAPPPALDTGGARINPYHHPNRIFRPEDDDEAD